MAATAERLGVREPYLQQDESFSISTEPLNSPLSVIQGTGARLALDQAVWIAADAVPDLRQARQEADVQAAEIYESYMVHVREGDVSEVPLDFDTISGAERALQVRRQHGKNSDEYREAWQGLFTDHQRYLDETWSKLAPEYFPPLRHTHDSAIRDYRAFGQPITPMIDRGITPRAEPEEVPRRFMEKRENSTNNRLGELVMQAAGVRLVDRSVPAVALPLELRHGPVSSQTISECPDHIIERYERDVAAGRKRGYGGYAPQIKKLMLRDVSFDIQTGDRYVEQLAVSGEYITHEVVLLYFERKRVIPEGTKLSKTEVLGLQAITNSTEGVIGMGRELDAIASELSGKNVYLGQEVPGDHPKNYEAIPAEAAARQEKHIADAEKLTEYTLQLAEVGVDHETGNRLYDEKVLELMFEAAKKDLQMAEIAFGKETADGLRRSQLARVYGDYDLADWLERQARETAPPPEGCSGAGCEIKEVNPNTALGAHIAKITKAKPGDKLTVDESKTRRCGKCGGQLAYSSNSRKYSGACLNSDCNTFKTKTSIIKN